MTTLYLVRHADHGMLDKLLVGRSAGVALAPQGREQADRLAGWFARRKVDGVWASPLRRARETADPIARTHGLPVIVGEALNEVEFGQWTGMDFETLAGREDWRRWNAGRSTARAPRGECMLEVQTRLTRFLHALAERDPQGAHVVVSHGDPIRCVLAYYLGVPIDLFLRIEVSPASVSVLSLENGSPRVLRVNAIPDEDAQASAR